jgi:dynein light chain Tctex-type 1
MLFSSYIFCGYSKKNNIHVSSSGILSVFFKFFFSLQIFLCNCPIISLEMDDTNETSFVVDEVSNVIKESIEATIGSQSYQQAKINTWTSNIVEAILNSLTKLNKPFKYIVSCVIMQKNGAGLHTASSCFWDNTTDGSCTVR